MMRAALLALPLLLAACGLREPLRPVEGQGTPPAPVAMDRPLTTDEMLTPPTTARPERVDELLRRSEERVPDRFDLPPANEPGERVPPETEEPE